MRTLGIDLAAADSNTGLCSIDWTPQGPSLLHLAGQATNAEILEQARGATCVGIDAPFGWPEAFVRSLTAHHAGQAWTHPTDTDSRRELQRRRTDTLVHQRHGLLPLSVSSDRIAAPAMRCAWLLGQWGISDRSGVHGFAEVYPAAALKAWGLAARGYKGKKGAEVRTEIVTGLLAFLPSLSAAQPSLRELCTEDDNVLDALVCALIARALTLDLTEGPDAEDQPAAQVEGWIHVPSAHSLEALAEPPPGT